MNILCTQENLQKSLAYLDKIVVKSSNLPILSNILFETVGGQIKLSATNLEIGVTTYVGGKIKNEGSIALPAKIVSNFVNNLPAGEVVEISVQDQKVILQSGGYNLSVFGVDGKEFPIIPRRKAEKELIFKGGELKTALQRVIYAASTNVIRPELTGVYFVVGDNECTLVATDSFRLVEEKISTSGAISIEDIIIPIDALQEVLKIVGNDDEDVLVSVEENQLFFRVGITEVTSRIINGKFPDYKQIIPENFSDSIRIQKDDLLRALKIAGSLSSYTSGEVALICNKEAQECKIVSRSHDVGENISTLPFENMGGQKDITLFFQARFLQDFLMNSSDDEIEISYNSEHTPVLFISPKNTNLRAIVMPIRK